MGLKKRRKEKKIRGEKTMTKTQMTTKSYDSDAAHLGSSGQTSSNTIVKAATMSGMPR